MEENTFCLFYIGKLCPVRTVPFFSCYTTSFFYIMLRTFCEFTHSDYKSLQGSQIAIQDREVSIISKWMLSFSQKLSPLKLPKQTIYILALSSWFIRPRIQKGIRREEATQNRSRTSTPLYGFSLCTGGLLPM